jgi:hypothetical protein
MGAVAGLSTAFEGRINFVMPPVARRFERIRDGAFRILKVNQA